MSRVHRALVAILSVFCVSTGGAWSAAMKSPVLKIDSNPSQAEVFVVEPGGEGGKPRLLGKTPFSTDRLKPGLQSLQIKKEGFVPFNLQAFLEEGDLTDLGEVPLAKSGSVVTIWIVGEPHREPPPPALSADANELIERCGFAKKILGVAAEDFPTRLADAYKSKEPPDILVGMNYIPFDSVSESNLVTATGMLNVLGSIVFLVSDSPNFGAARHIATSAQGRSVYTRRLRTASLPSISDAGYQEQLKRVGLQAMSSYLKNDKKKLQSLACPEMLRTETTQLSPVQSDSTAPVAITGMDSTYAIGNSRLAFFLGKASYVADKSIGQKEIFSVWVKQGNQWKLLTISDDPLTLEIAASEIPQFARELTESKEQSLPLAELISPADGKMPGRGPAQRFGEYVWRSSESPDVLAEVAEFEYGTASRLFYNPKGKLSEGDLWTTRTPWSWRIWTIGKNGQVFFSETRHFQN